MFLFLKVVVVMVAVVAVVVVAVVLVVILMFLMDFKAITNVDIILHIVNDIILPGHTSGHWKT